MRRLMERFRQGELPVLKRLTIGKADVRLVHREERARFYQGNNWRAIVNADSDEEAVNILQVELRRTVEDIEGDTNNTLPSAQ